MKITDDHRAGERAADGGGSRARGDAMQTLRRGAVEDFENDHGNVALNHSLIEVYTAHSFATHAGTLESHRARCRRAGQPAGPAGLRARERPDRPGPGR